MKRLLIEKIPYLLPDELYQYTRGVGLYDSSCSPEARVYYIERDGGYYLKRAPLGTLCREAEMTKYFYSLGLGAQVLSYLSDKSEGCDWLLTRAVRGEDCTDARYISEPRRLCDLFAERLRALHEITPSGCPVADRTSEYLRVAEENYRTGNYDKSHFPDSFGYRTAEQAYAVLSDGAGALRSDTLIHGDYCLPNVILKDWRFSGFIDLGGAGVGDRHIDLFWGAWTLLFNLKTDKYRERFLDAYGRDRVEPELLRVVAAAEVFG